MSGAPSSMRQALEQAMAQRNAGAGGEAGMPEGQEGAPDMSGDLASVGQFLVGLAQAMQSHPQVAQLVAQIMQGGGQPQQAPAQPMPMG